MIYRELTEWIADSESWQSHIDYRVADTQVQRRLFLARSTDFYISLLSQLQEALASYFQEETSENKRDLLALAKGLEIYSLEIKRDRFQGINYRRNMLYVAALYYLSDFSATAILLLRQFSENDFDGALEKFLFFFLSRNNNRAQANNNPYFNKIFNFLRNGEASELLALGELIETMIGSPEIDSRHFVLAFFSRSVIKKFSNNNIWIDLLPYAEPADWRPYIRFNIGKFPAVWSFFPSQKAGIAAGLLTFERAFSLQTPTSSGKTAISELVIYNELRKNPSVKILYLAPFRALASELRNNLGRNLSAKLNISVKTIYGGNVVTDFDRISIESASLLISTPEKFMAIETSEPGILDEFNLIVCDEGHLIDNNTRGISYELLLSRLKRSVDHPKRFLFLSAIVPNIEQINLWLGGRQEDVAISNYRPTEIELAFLNQRSPREFDLQVNPEQNIPRNYTVENFLTKDDFVGETNTYTPGSYKAKAVSAALKSLNSGAVAIFSPTKDDSQGVAGLAAEVINQAIFNLPDPADYADQIAQANLLEYFEYVFGIDYLLTQSIRHGFLFHHGDLPQFIRELIESYVREEKIKLLICTTTLSEGVNLPIKTLVIKTAKRFNGKVKQVLPYRDLKNLIGRAGRAGKETKGTIIVITPGEFNIFLDIINNRGLEPANGFLFYVVEAIDAYILRQGSQLTNELLDLLEQSDIIDNAIIHLLAEDISIDQLEAEIRTLTQNTFTYFQSTPERRQRLETIFDLRLDKIRTAARDNKIQSIKTTGIPLRLYDEYVAEITFDLPLLETLDNPVDNEWLEFLIDNLLRVNEVKRFFSIGYTRAQLIKVIQAWLNGHWYLEIADILETNVTVALQFMKFLEYDFQTHANSIIRYIEERRTAEDLSTSYVVTEWTNYLSFGVRTNLQIALIDLGVSDRVLVWILSNWLIENNMAANDPATLRETIAQNAATIITGVSPAIPVISRQQLLTFINRIRLNTGR